MAQPWEMQKTDTPKSWEAFVEYRDMEKRSLAKVADKLGKSVKLIERWSQKHDWVNRVASWDEEKDRLVRIELTKDIGAMRKRHADIASAMLMKAARALARIPDDEIKATDITRMVDVATKLERISKGDVGDVIEERNGGEAIDPVQFYMPDNGRDPE